MVVGKGGMPSFLYVACVPPSTRVCGRGRSRGVAWGSWWRECCCRTCHAPSLSRGDGGGSVSGAQVVQDWTSVVKRGCARIEESLNSRRSRGAVPFPLPCCSLPPTLLPHAPARKHEPPHATHSPALPPPHTGPTGTSSTRPPKALPAYPGVPQPPRQIIHTPRNTTYYHE